MEQPPETPATAFGHCASQDAPAAASSPAAGAPRYGALPEEWKWAADIFGGANLLPVVSNPDAEISPNSTLKSLGKQPSRYSSGKVVGIPKWTTYEASEREVSAWRSEPDYGIFVVLRDGWIALDADVDDPAKALRYVRTLLENMGLDPDRQACRWRESSGRLLVPVKLNSERRKCVVPVDGGNLEVLGTGGGFAGFGLHVASGTRYRWSPLSHLGGDLA